MIALEHLRQMAHSPLHNYVIPGLTSWLIGQPGPNGAVRMLECSRQHTEVVTPHSHRFDFRCVVLKGKVRQHLWAPNDDGDLYAEIEQKYMGTPGTYTTQEIGRRRWKRLYRDYLAGDEYGMSAEEVHHIDFNPW